MKKQQSGFAIIELFISIVVIAVIVGIGYFVWHGHQATTNKLGYKSPAVATPTAPHINSSSDLNSALQALNQTSVSSSNTDSSQLSTQASGF
ncbi:MAG TPA: hypothetical protein VNE40_00935 [Candidatus Dormibacteraeota bacterium]|nr:hypothetical protein [Candidatus Dormibacteraeota bacterium]